MKTKLMTLILTAAVVPTLALSTAVMADEQDDLYPFGEQSAGEQHTGDQHLEEQRAGMVGRPAGALYADNVIGKAVKHRGSGEEVGEIEDLIIDDEGRIIGAVLTTSVFLGLGGQYVALGWDHVEYTLEDEEPVFSTDIDEATLRNSPEYVRD